MSTPVYNVYFVAGNVDPTPPRPPKAPAKPAVRLALTPHAPPATPVVAPAAIPGTISVPRRPSAVQPQVPVGTDDDKQERRTTSSFSRSRTRRRHRASPHRHHHRDHHSLRPTSRSERGRSVRTALSSFFFLSSSPSSTRSMPHSYWSLGPVCWKHSSQSACSSSQSSCSSSLETVFSLPSSGGRPTCTADSLFHSTWCCMAPNQGRWNRKSDFSNTFELGRDAYRETVEQYLSRSSDSTKFSSSCNQVRRQPFCHCTEAPSSGSSVQSVYRLGLLW